MNYEIMVITHEMLRLHIMYTLLFLDKIFQTEGEKKGSIVEPLHFRFLWDAVDLNAKLRTI